MITRTDYIFAGYSHDIPFIAKKVIGSRATTNILLSAGVNKSQVVTISGGENPDFQEFSVQVIEAGTEPWVTASHIKAKQQYDTGVTMSALLRRFQLRRALIYGSNA